MQAQQSLSRPPTVPDGSTGIMDDDGLTAHLTGATRLGVRGSSQQGELLPESTVCGAPHTHPAPRTRKYVVNISHIPRDIITAFMERQSCTEPSRDDWMRDNQHRLPPMRQMPATGTIRVLNNYEQKSIKANKTKFLVIRFDNMLSDDDQRRLLDKWTDVETSGAGYYPTRSSEDSRHWRAFSIFHLGTWKRQSMLRPHLSAGIRQRGTANLATRATRQIAVLSYMRELDIILGGKVHWRLNKMDGDAVHRAGKTAGRWAGTAYGVQKANRGERWDMDMEEVTDEVFDTVGGNPLRLGGLGTMIAVTRGQAEKHHLDPGDANYTLVIPIAPDGWGDEDEDEEGMRGQLELPQLGLRIPLRPGQVLAFRAGTLLHRATELSEADAAKRLVTTVFTCNQAQGWFEKLVDV